LQAPSTTSQESESTPPPFIPPPVEPKRVRISSRAPTQIYRSPVMPPSIPWNSPGMPGWAMPPAMENPQPLPANYPGTYYPQTPLLGGYPMLPMHDRQQLPNINMRPQSYPMRPMHGPQQAMISPGIASGATHMMHTPSARRDPQPVMINPVINSSATYPWNFTINGQPYQILLTDRDSWREKRGYLSRQNSGGITVLHDLLSDSFDQNHSQLT